jgi:sugar/nucleoside kinase (ribokinase family)
MDAEPAPIAIVGNLNADQWVRTVRRFPRWDEEIVVDSSRIELAGTAGYMLLAGHGLGWPAVVVSTIGDDLYGAFLQDELRRLGVATDGVETISGCETCLGMIFVGPDGQRAILSTLGAHALMDVAVARRHDAAVGRCAEVVLCGSYLLPRFGPSDILPYARALRARDQTVVFDPSWDPGGWSETTRRETLALLDEVDVYLPNEPELLHLTGASDLESAIAALGGRPREVVVKRGAEGALYVAGADRVAVPGYDVAPVNTIGAGDVFDVAYLYARRQGWLPAERLRFACALAAMVVAQPGDRAYPDAAAVAAFREEAERAARIHA